MGWMVVLWAAAMGMWAVGMVTAECDGRAITGWTWGVNLLSQARREVDGGCQVVALPIGLQQDAELLPVSEGGGQRASATE